MQELPTVLVVEDEILIQHVVEEALTEGGFKVVLSGTAEDAIEFLGSNGADIRALVTDINLGKNGWSGWEIARHARERHPELAVIYMTGDSAAEWAAQGVPNSILLNKPFAAAQLVTAIAQLLNKAPSLE